MNLRTVARLLWWVFLASVFLYPVVAYVLPVKAATIPVGALMGALYAVAAILAVSSVWIRSRFCSPETVLKYGEMPLARTGIPPESDEGRKLLVHYATQWLLRVYMISWALAESISILGLVAALVAGRPSAILPFSVASLALIVRIRPDFSVADAVGSGRV